MLWLILSVFSGLFQSIRDLFSKKELQSLDEYVVSFSMSFFSLPFLLPLLFFTEIPNLDVTFWFLVLAIGCLFSTASILYLKAIKISPLSLSVPMLAFTPLLLLITSPLMLGEFPSSLGLIGVLLIVAGTYALSIKDVREGYLAPFRALIKEKGPLIMLFVAVLFSIGANLIKIGIQQSSPLIFPAILNASTSALLLPVMLIKTKKAAEKIRNNFVVLFIIGLFGGLMSICAQTAMQLGIVPYVISVKRTNIIFSTSYGYLFFKEKRMMERFTGAIIMFFGILLISFS